MSGSTVFLFPDDNSDIVAFDLTKSESHTFTSVLTKNPVESGATVTDHVVVDPATFSCVVQITNTPVDTTFEHEGALGPISFHLAPYPPTQVPFDALIGAITGPATQPNMVTGFQIGNPVDRVKRTLDRLNVLRLAVQTMSVLTSKHQYDNMVLTGIQLPIEKESYGVFTLTFDELIIVTTDQVTAPKPKEPRGAPMTNAGVSNPAEAALQQGQALAQQYLSGNRSLLRDGAQFFGF